MPPNPRPPLLAEAIERYIAQVVLIPITERLRLLEERLRLLEDRDPEEEERWR